MVERLGEPAHGSTALGAQGSSIKEIVTNFAASQNEDDDTRDFDRDSKAGPQSETGTWGSMSFKVARGVIGYLEKEGEPDDEAADKMMKIFAELEGIQTAGHSWHPSDYS